MAMGQKLRYLFGDDYPPKVVYLKGFWDVHRGTGVLTHCHIIWTLPKGLLGNIFFSRLPCFKRHSFETPVCVFC